MTDTDAIKIFVSAVVGILVPITLLVVGRWYTKQKERTDRNQRDADRLALLLKHLASNNKSERLLALQVLGYLVSKDEFPRELSNTIAALAFTDTPEVAAAASVLIGGTDKVPDEIVLLELVGPAKVHFDRTREAFAEWRSKDEYTESRIKQSNMYIRDLLLSRAYLIPKDLRDVSRNLVEHYNAWLAEYDRVYKDGKRDPTVHFVFVGDKGVPFPTGAEKKFLEKFEELRSNLEARRKLDRTRD